MHGVCDAKTISAVEIVAKNSWWRDWKFALRAIRQEVLVPQTLTNKGENNLHRTQEWEIN